MTPLDIPVSVKDSIQRSFPLVTSLTDDEVEHSNDETKTKLTQDQLDSLPHQQDLAQSEIFHVKHQGDELRSTLDQFQGKKNDEPPCDEGKMEQIQAKLETVLQHDWNEKISDEKGVDTLFSMNPGVTCLTDDRGIKDFDDPSGDMLFETHMSKSAARDGGVPLKCELQGTSFCSNRWKNVQCGRDFAGQQHIELFHPSQQRLATSDQTEHVMSENTRVKCHMFC